MDEKAIQMLINSACKLDITFSGTINFEGTLHCVPDPTEPNPPDPPVEPPVEPPGEVVELFMQHFGDAALTDEYDTTDASRDFGQIKYSNGIGWQNLYNVQILDSDIGRFMRINTHAGELGPDYGCMFAKVISETEVFFSYNCKFSPDWEPTKGGKLFGTTGGVTQPPSQGPSTGFSTRWMWQPGCTLMYYVYWPDQQSEYGTSFGLFPDPQDMSRDFSFYNDGEPKWFNFTQRVKLNSDGSTADGFLEAYIDGILVQSVKNLRLRTTTDVTIEEMLQVHYFGGSSDDYRPSKDQAIDVDDIRLFQVPELSGEPLPVGTDISHLLVMKS